MAHPYATSAAAVSGRAIDDASLLSGAFWDELRTFLAVAKAGSINQAALNLRMSKATVSRQVKRLHDVVGTQLLVATKSGARLTEEGQALARILLDFDRRVFTFEKDAKGTRSTPAGVVRLSITDGIGVVFAVPALRGFSARNPLVDIHLLTPRNMRSLRENQTDIMVGFGSEASTDIMSRRLGSIHLTTMISQAYVDQKGLPTLEDAHQHDFVDSSRYSARGSMWDPWHELVARGRQRYLTDAAITYAMMVKAGLGIGLVTSFNILQPTALHVDLGVHVTLPIYASALAERLSSPAVASVFRFISELFDPSVSWFSDELDLSGSDAGGYSELFNT